MNDFHQNQLLQIKRFVKGQMNDSESAIFIKEMDSDPFLKEAVEGFQRVKGSVDSVDSLKQKGLGNSSVNVILKSVFVIVVLIGAYVLYLNSVSETDPSIAEIKSDKKEIQQEVKPQIKTLENDTIENYKVLLSKETDTSLHIAVGSLKEIKVIPNENFVTIKSIEKTELDEIKVLDFDPIEIEELEGEIEEAYDYYFIEDYKLFNYLTGRDIKFDRLKPILNGVPASQENESSEDPFQDYIYETVDYHEFLRIAVNELSEENYKKAHKMFANILKAHTEDVNASFYSAYCSFKLKKYKRALKEFKLSVELKNNLFQEEANYHYGLCAMKNKDRELSYQIMNQIAASQGFYQQQAQDFLDNNF